MTEEIIIDGVNVAGCRHLSFVEEDYCCDCQYEKYASCEGYNCTYKQLKRLEQENARLKEENEILKQSGKTLAEGVCKQNDLATKYKSALEEIREILRTPEVPPPDDNDLMTATELLVIVDSIRQTKLTKIKDKINEVLK